MKKTLYDIIQANRHKAMPFDVVHTSYSGKPTVYAVVYACDRFAVLEDLDGDARLVAYACEDLADEMIGDERAYQSINRGTQAKPEPPAVAPRTVKVAIYAFQKGSLWYQSAMYYKDDTHFMQLNPATPEFKRVVQSEIEVSV